MTYKLLGALLIISGCGIIGHLRVKSHKNEVAALKKLIAILEYMSCMLEYQPIPLPEIFRQIDKQFIGNDHVFSHLADELDSQISPDIQRCMRVVLSKIRDIPKLTLDALLMLGDNLGHFDLAGQLKGIHAVRMECEEKLKKITDNQEARLRTYQTLSLCAGAAIAIIFI